MSLALPVVAALVIGLVLGGRPDRLARLPLRWARLFIAALALQLVAFPFAFLPWTTDAAVASTLWITSYGLLAVAAVLNLGVTGVPIVAGGMCLNLAAILANRGTMPVVPGAMRDAGAEYVTRANSTAMAEPRLGWLVDRWAAPDWVPLANVYSLGDVLIAVGAVVIVLVGMGVRTPRLLPQRRAL